MILLYILSLVWWLCRFDLGLNLKGLLYLYQPPILTELTRHFQSLFVLKKRKNVAARQVADETRLLKVTDSKELLEIHVLTADLRPLPLNIFLQSFTESNHDCSEVLNCILWATDLWLFLSVLSLLFLAEVSRSRNSLNASRFSKSVLVFGYNEHSTLTTGKIW